MLLADELPLQRIRHPWVTHGLILANAAIFLLALADTTLLPQLMLQPPDLLANPAGTAALRGLFGHMFLHVGWLHLLGNMLMLYVLGDNVEDSLGHLRFLFCYLACGLAGGLCYALLSPAPGLPMVGASGAIAGVMGGYLLLYPRAKLLVLAFNRLPVLVPASWFVGSWIALNLLQASFSEAEGEAAGIAWWAHVGGFLAGMALVALLRPAGVELFQPALASPSPRLAWARRVGFDFAPEPGPRAAGPDEAPPEDTRLAVLGKAALFVLLLFLSAWI